MSTNPVHRLTAVTGIVLVLALAGCASPTADDPEPRVSAPSTRSVPPSNPSTSAPSTSAPEELTAEEQLRVNPPPPQALSAAREGDAVTLTWSPPPAVTVPHTYSDTVVEYRIYRSADGGDEVLVGTSATLGFTDTKPGAGMLRYAVSSVREHGVEGPRADAVVAPPAS